MGKYKNRRARVKASGENGKTVRGEWWNEIAVGTTQGGVDSMELFESLVDELESDLAKAGIRGVQFVVQKEVHQARNMDFADDVMMVLEHEEELQPALDIVQEFYLKPQAHSES